jgi:hypothetical protein
VTSDGSRTATPGTTSRKNVLDHMRRAGLTSEQIERAGSVLPDPVAALRDDDLLARFGFDRNSRVDRMSGNP